MANKHEAHEPGMKPAVWAWSKPGTVRFYTGPGRPSTNKRARLGQETRHGGQARHGPFTPKPVKPAFCTKTCLPIRLARFSARFFRAKRAAPARLGPLRAELEQKIEPAGLDGPAQFSNRAWWAGPGPGQAAHLAISNWSHEFYRNQSIS
jgi:hypothetical protein